MNIKRLIQPLAVTFVAAGAILFAAPVHAQETEPSASFVSFCNELLLINDMDVDLDFQLNFSNKGGVTTVRAHQQATAQVAWQSGETIDITVYNGDQVVLTATAARPEECDQNPMPTPAASFVSFCDTLLLLNEGNTDLVFDLSSDGHGGQVSVPAGQQVETPANWDANGQIAVKAYYGNQLVLEAMAGRYEGCDQVTTTTVEVAVGEPPVPPTTPTTPVDEPEVPVIRSLEVIGECDLYTITNTGNVRTSEYDDILLGVALNKNNEPPYMIYLEPGQSVSFDLEVGDKVSLNLSEDWTVTSSTDTGSSEYTASSCEVIDVDLGDDIINLYGTVDPTDPATMVLPETGAGELNKKMSGTAVLLLMAGVFFVLVTRRRPVM